MSKMFPHGVKRVIRREWENWELREMLEDDTETYKRMAESMSCGGCGLIINVDSEYTCEHCGRMLCDRCGTHWGVCKDHRPKCHHPDIIPTTWDQSRPKPAIVEGNCRHNYTCPVCGYGRGEWPCSCHPITAAKTIVRF